MKKLDVNKMWNEAYQEQIDRYILGQMSSDERVSFERNLISNKDLLNQFCFSRQVQTAISHRAEKMNRLIAWQSEEYNRSRRSRRTRYYWLSGMAAVVVLGFVAVARLVLLNGVGEMGTSPYLRRGNDVVFGCPPSTSSDTIVDDAK